MKIAVVGSRSYRNKEKVFRVLDAIREAHNRSMHFVGNYVEVDNITIVSGGAAGADRLGETWANFNKFPTEIFLPDWDKNGLSAGMIRNTEIVEAADVLVAFWDGQSKGTLDSIKKAVMKGIPVNIYGEKTYGESLSEDSNIQEKTPVYKSPDIRRGEE